MPATSDNGTKASELDYEQLELLGQGAFGEVFLVRQRSTNTLCALKTIDKRFIRRQRKEHSIFQEKLILCALQSAHTTRLMATFQNERTLHFVLEYASGGSLAQLLARRGTLSLAETRFCAASIVLILEHVHGWGVIHRDIKPENLLLDASGQLQLTDFGASDVRPLPGRNDALFEDFAAIRRRAGLPVHGKELDDRTQGKSLVGTVYYVAPEMLDESEVSFGCDLWALGVLLHRLATGKYLFDGESDYFVFESIRRCEYTLDPDLDPQLADLIQQLVRVDATHRLGVSDGLPALRAHPFLAPIDFAHLRDTPSPLRPAGAKKPEPIFRGRVKRKRLHFFYEALELVLYSDGRVECLDKGRVWQRMQLDALAEVRRESEGAFRLCAEGRAAIFYARNEDVRAWLQRFGEVIAGFSPSCKN